MPAQNPREPRGRVRDVFHISASGKKSRAPKDDVAGAQIGRPCRICLMSSHISEHAGTASLLSPASVSGWANTPPKR